MNAYTPPGIPADLVAWKEPEPESQVKRGPPGPRAEAWLKRRVAGYADGVRRVVKAREGRG